VLAARNGDIQITQAEQDLERAAMMFAQADIYEEEAQKLEKEATGYVEEGRKFGPQMLALTEKIGNLDPEADRDRLNAAQAKLDELIEKRRALDEKFEEVDAERSEKQTNCNWDREDAGILRNDALKALSVTTPEEEERIDAATRVIEQAELSLRSSGRAAAMENLLAGSEALEEISLRPDRRASPVSLPGRLYSILSAPTSSS